MTWCRMTQCVNLTHTNWGHHLLFSWNRDIILASQQQPVNPAYSHQPHKCKLTLGVPIPEACIDTSTHTQRKGKVRDVGDLSQCLCGLAFTAAQMGNKAIQCRKPGCKTEWVSKFNWFIWLVLMVLAHSIIYPVSSVAVTKSQLFDKLIVGQINYINFHKYS